MTKKELVANINEMVMLYGVSYKPSMKMLKEELEAMYLECVETSQQAYNDRFNQTITEQQAETPVQTKEETEMTNQTTLVREFKTNLEGHKKFLGIMRDFQPITAGQEKFRASMLRNYNFDGVEFKTPMNAKEMSQILWDMELMIHNGQVAKRNAEEVVAALKGTAQPAPQVAKDAVTDRQVAYIKSMAHELHRWVNIPQTKKEASELIKALDDEVQKLRFSKAVAITTDQQKAPEAPEEAPKLSWFDKVVRFFKRG